MEDEYKKINVNGKEYYTIVELFFQDKKHIVITENIKSFNFEYVIVDNLGKYVIIEDKNIKEKLDRMVKGNQNVLDRLE